ncbi:MAG: class I tRNA ligase family protein [Gammaproteobacteria bacterium]|nr:class I tRNA ligase family protein [Gammaproteobacteria bacterium]
MDAKKYLIIPSVPTPNGGLHLGHIAGPYLRADILARHLRMQGHHVNLVCGTDSYDSYVTYQAHLEQKTELEICHRYHKQIKSDLDGMNIGYDQFVNPVSQKWCEQYKQQQHEIWQLLVQAKAINQQEESILFDGDKALTDVWLKGNCPVCEAAVQGLFCEACGSHFKPQDVKNAYPTLTTKQQHILCKKITHHYLQLPQRAPPLHQQGISSDVEKKFADFLQHQQHQLRLTNNTHWGIAHNDLSTKQPQRFFNYGFVYAYFLMLANTVKQQVNAFAHDSNVTTIASFGHDNAIVFLASILGITYHLPNLKPFDAYLVNQFLLLDNEKFSTSRRHAIWVDNITQSHDVDVVRYFLTTIDINQQSGNFSRQYFDDFIGIL